VCRWMHDDPCERNRTTTPPRSRPSENARTVCPHAPSATLDDRRCGETLERPWPIRAEIPRRSASQIHRVRSVLREGTGFALCVEQAQRGDAPSSHRLARRRYVLGKTFGGWKGCHLAGGDSTPRVVVRVHGIERAPVARCPKQGREDHARSVSRSPTTRGRA
jgi:hypothetical protein